MLRLYILGCPLLFFNQQDTALQSPRPSLKQLALRTILYREIGFTYLRPQNILNLIGNYVGF